MKNCYNNPNITKQSDLFTENLKLIREVEKARELNCILISFLAIIAFVGIAFLILAAPSGLEKHFSDVSYNATKSTF